MTHTADYWIKKLDLAPHPEGGYYREVYRSGESLPADSLPSRYGGSRNFSTSIYYLLRKEDRSVFHRIKSDEIWHFYEGAVVTLHIISFEGIYENKCLGTEDETNSLPQIMVPYGNWFGAEIAGDGEYALMGCTVAPAFDFNDFEKATRKEMLVLCPSKREIILRLTGE